MSFQEKLDKDTSFNELQKETIRIEVKEWIESTISCTCDSESPDTMCDYCFLLSQINNDNETKKGEP